MTTRNPRRRRLLSALIEVSMTLSGLVVVAVPLALWAAQSVTAYYVILATGAAGFIAFCLLANIQQRLTGAGASRVEGANGSVPQVRRWISDPAALPSALRADGQGIVAEEWHQNDMHDPAVYKLRRSGVREGFTVLGWTFGTASTLMVAGGVLLFLVYLLLDSA